MADPSFGLWPPGAGGSTPSTQLTPVAAVLLRLGTGTEAIQAQIGADDNFSGLVVNDVGDYTLQIAPESPLANGSSDACYLVAHVNDFACRICNVIPILPSNEISVNVFDAAGARAACGRLSIVVWYGTPV